MERTENFSISEHYRHLGRTDKGKFLRQVMSQTGMGLSTVMTRLKDGNWRPADRMVIEQYVLKSR